MSCGLFVHEEEKVHTMATRDKEHDEVNIQIQEDWWSQHYPTCKDYLTWNKIKICQNIISMNIYRNFPIRYQIHIVSLCAVEDNLVRVFVLTEYLKAYMPLYTIHNRETP